MKAAVVSLLLLAASASAQSDACTAGQNAIQGADNVAAGFASVEASATAQLAGVALKCQGEIVKNHSCTAHLDWRDSQGALNKYSDAVKAFDKKSKLCSFDCAGTFHWPTTLLAKNTFNATKVNYMYASSNCTHNDTANIVAKFSDHINTFFKVAFGPLFPDMSCKPTEPDCFL